MIDWREYTVVERGGEWPAGEGRIVDSADGRPLAEVREEPWPDVVDRPWPDGAANRPLLMRLFGVDRRPRQNRTVVRRSSDGRVLVRLHRRQPSFQYTVGLFDVDDRRFGYARWPFKGSRGESFALVDVDHRTQAAVE
ncbi:MAG: hypothetical protein ACRDD1_16670, partial [Planctomycetia bacterium]